jgi:hypothetical protein
VAEVSLVGKIDGLNVKAGKEGEKHHDVKLLLTQTPESLDEIEALMGETLVIALSKMQTEMFKPAPAKAGGRKRAARKRAR